MLTQQLERIAIWQQVQAQVVARLPVRRNLQDRRPADAAVGDEHEVAEALPIATCFDWQGYAAEILPVTDEGLPLHGEVHPPLLVQGGQQAGGQFGQGLPQQGVAAGAR